MIWDTTTTNIPHPKQATVRAQHRFSSFLFFFFLSSLAWSLGLLENICLLARIFFLLYADMYSHI